jgi:hypothetical protein
MWHEEITAKATKFDPNTFMALRNIELHPNESASQRRDVVAMNTAERGVWKRIHADYGSRQLIFETKNKCGLEPEDYRQMLSCLTGEYGRLGFIVTRDKAVDLVHGPELEWTKAMYHYDRRVLIVKLTGELFCSLLSKLRSPQKHDVADDALQKILDRYVRLR